MKTLRRCTAFFLLVFLCGFGSALAQEKLSPETLDTITKIRYEGFRNSKIMEGLIHGGLLLNHNYHSDYRPKNRGRNFHLRICRAPHQEHLLDNT